MSKIKISSIRLGIAMPTAYPIMYTAVFDAFVEMKKPYDYIWIRPNNANINKMRNDAVELAMATQRTHLLMFDADMTLDKHTITQLIKVMLEKKIYICGANCFMRYPPFRPGSTIRLRKLCGGAQESRLFGQHGAGRQSLPERHDGELIRWATP